ncbi:uncharacterized protein LOC132702854 [Cylas formicarius]|uniref:uncharacterized protein LOC132702854 n=1 Tax=Cylas formicarius TaxID=197179 RepID=UPI002958C418|nr:uncharacterized protein LOC132702854 [Cylas formicarius]
MSESVTFSCARRQEYQAAELLQTSKIVLSNFEDCSSAGIEKLANVEKLCLKYINIRSQVAGLSTDLIDTIDHGKSLLFIDIDQIEKRLCSKNFKIDDLNRLLETQSKDLMEKTEYSSKMELQLESLSKKQKRFDLQKCMVLAYKLITNTNFVYNSSSVAGLMDCGQLKTFKFSTTKMTQEEITEILWKMLCDGK